MKPDQAAFLRDFLLTAISEEAKITRRVIAAVPDNRKSYRPHEKNMDAAQLAWHVAHADIWFLNSIADGAFQMDKEPEAPPTVEAIVSWYDENLPKAIARVRAMSGEELAREANFFGVWTLPAATFLNVANVHSIHHRGQLSAYLRPMGAKVPGIYGGSADEPFQMPATAQA